MPRRVRPRSRVILVGSRVCYRHRPDMQGVVYAIKGENSLLLPRSIFVRWEMRFGIIPGPVMESELFLELVSDRQTHTEAA